MTNQVFIAPVNNIIITNKQNEETDKKIPIS
jgi:hypothetical protein